MKIISKAYITGLDCEGLPMILTDVQELPAPAHWHLIDSRVIEIDIPMSKLIEKAQQVVARKMEITREELNKALETVS